MKCRTVITMLLLAAMLLSVSGCGIVEDFNNVFGREDEGKSVEAESTPTPSASESAKETAKPTAAPSETDVPAEDKKASPAEITYDEEALLRGAAELLIGLFYTDAELNQNVSEWCDETITSVIRRKLLWDAYSYEEGLLWEVYGLEYTHDDNGFWRFDLDVIQDITQDAFGREFPVDADAFSAHSMDYATALYLFIMPATGESTEFDVESVEVQGGNVIATGTAYYHGGITTRKLGGFEAVLSINPDSAYGMTLISVKATTTAASGQSSGLTVTNPQLIQNLTATASSYLSEDVANHTASNVLDGNLKTAWVENAAGVGVGEWIQLVTKDVSEIVVSEITFNLGFQATSQLLAENGWPTKILLEGAGGFATEITFDAYDSTVVLDAPVQTSWLRFTILEAEAGTKFLDTCICEIKVYGEQ